MAAAAGPGLCPHCGRPFKRLRAHLPHCKAAPAESPWPAASPAPGGSGARAPGASPQPSAATGSVPGLSPAPSPSPAPRGSGASAPGASPQPSVPGPSPAPSPSPAPGTAPRPAASPAPGGSGGSAPGAGPQPSVPGPSPRPAPRSASRAVRDVARSLDLHPEEVRDVPRKLQKGVKVVIERHRARLVREKEPRSRGEGTEPGPAPLPQRRKTAPKSKSEEPRSQGSGTGSSKGGKSRLKATKALQEPAESRNSPAELVRQERTGKSTAGEERGQLEVGVGSELHAEKIHLSCRDHGQGTAKNEPSRLQSPRASGEQGEGVAEPTPGTAPELALLHTPKIQPSCSSRASGRSAAGLEWFPDLYPDPEGLRVFPGKRFHEDGRSTVETPEGARGQRGPLSERPLMEVRLGELHTWISTCNFSPQGLLGAVQRAWSSYCAKYIHVKQGGPAGISMLLAGYCLLSYGWNYQHFKRHRWRKYH